MADTIKIFVSDPKALVGTVSVSVAEATAAAQAAANSATEAEQALTQVQQKSQMVIDGGDSSSSSAITLFDGGDSTTSTTSSSGNIHDIIKVRRDTAANWTANNPIIAEGELALIKSATAPAIKFGDGVTPWNDLALFSAGKSIESIMWATPGTYTFTVPAGVTQITLYGCGGGGGANSNFGLAGGGAECAFGVVLTVVPGETLTIVVGAGGAGAAAGYTTQSGGVPIPGGDGENTTITGSFGTVTLHGGYGGGKDGKFDPGASGGSGGEDGGMPAQYGTATTSGTTYMLRVGGVGGNTMYGTGGKPGRYCQNPSWATMKDGRPGLGYGAGAGGGDHCFDGVTLSTAGGAGAKGMVCLVYEEAA